MNTRARTVALKQLLRMKHGAKYDAHWHGKPGSPGKPKKSGLFALIRQTDDHRNKIVHWRTTAVIENGVEKDDQLVMPDFWYRSAGEAPEPVTTQALEHFILKTEFVHRSINMFVWAQDPRRPLPPGTREEWEEIFAQPAIYPPLDTHPLSPSYVAPQTNPLSSG